MVTSKHGRALFIIFLVPMGEVGRGLTLHLSRLEATVPNNIVFWSTDYSMVGCKNCTSWLRSFLQEQLPTRVIYTFQILAAFFLLLSTVSCFVNSSTDRNSEQILTNDGLIDVVWHWGCAFRHAKSLQRSKSQEKLQTKQKRPIAPIAVINHQQEIGFTISESMIYFSPKCHLAEKCYTFSTTQSQRNISNETVKKAEIESLTCSSRYIHSCESLTCSLRYNHSRESFTCSLRYNHSRGWLFKSFYPPLSSPCNQLGLHSVISYKASVRHILGSAKQHAYISEIHQQIGLSFKFVETIVELGFEEITALRALIVHYLQSNVSEMNGFMADWLVRNCVIRCWAATASDIMPWCIEIPHWTHVLTAGTYYRTYA